MFYSFDKKEMFEEIRRNELKRFAFSIFVILLYFFLFFLSFEIATTVGDIFLILLVFLSFFVAGLTIVKVYFSPLPTFKEQLKDMRAYKLEKPKDEKEKMLMNVVDEIVVAGLLPKKPEVYIIETDEPNAFAVSKNEDSIIGVTRGLLERMNRAELSAVIAHEVAHILNKDSEYKLLVVCFSLAGLVALRIFLETFRFGFSSSNNKKSSFGGIAFIVIIIAFILFYIISQIAIFAMSRRQEYNADLGSLRLTRDKNALISALKKLDDYAKEIKKKQIMISSRYSSSSYFFEKKELPGYMYFWDIKGLFRTHPTIEERIKYIESIA